MKKIFIFSGLLILLFTTGIYANPYPVETIWGAKCGKSKSIAVKFKNPFSITKDFKVCVQRASGKWQCYVHSGVKPDEVSGVYWSWFVCSGTGRYWLSAVDSGTGKHFKNPPGY